MFRTSVILLCLTVAACGGSTTPSPTAPSPSPSPSPSPAPAPAPSFVSMTGFWGGSGHASSVTDRNTGAPLGFNMNCTLSWSFTSQTEGAFTGRLSSDGNSPESDWRCSYFGSISGQLAADGAISLRFDPAFTPGGCTNAVAPDTMNGQMSGNDNFTVTSSGTATCRMLLGNPDPAHIRDLSYVLTVTGRRR